MQHIDLGWIHSVEELMKDYTEKTDGSYIQTKESLVVWNYKDCDIEFGNAQAAELQGHIQNVFRNWPLEVVSGYGFLEVKPSKMKKVSILIVTQKQRRLLKEIFERMNAKKSQVDFVLYIGTDSTNEECFKFLRSPKIPYFKH